jgi:hypothetical protein
VQDGFRSFKGNEKYANNTWLVENIQKPQVVSPVSPPEPAVRTLLQVGPFMQHKVYAKAAVPMMSVHTEHYEDAHARQGDSAD